MKKHAVKIYGMHCSSCEVLVHKEVSKIAGVKYLEVSHKTGMLEVIHDESLDKKEIEEAICRCGYRLAPGEEAQPSFNHFSLTEGNITAWIKAGSILVILYYLFTTISQLPFFQQVSTVNQSSLSLPLAFMVGLVASFSTCLAVVGSVVLGLSASFKQKTTNPLMPQLVFQSGRLASFFLLGGLLGLIGTNFRYSPTLSAFLNILVAVVIFYLALSLLNLVPPMKSLLSSFSPSLGGKLSQLEGEGSYKAAFLMGGLTFFLPCGFTQSMQVLALGQADFIKSGLTMLFFALGTLPVLLGVGALGTSMKTLKDPALAKVIVVILIVFAFFNLNTGLALKGLSLPLPSLTLQAAETSGSSALKPEVQGKTDSGRQIIEMEVNNSGYTPRAFTIKKGVPVEWRINATALNGCNGTIIMPDLKIEKQLQDGLNTIAFTPQKVGRLNFSCWMGMIRGYFEVVENSGTAQVGPVPQDKQDPKAAGGGSCGGGAGGCGCGRR
ncbi:MAG: sulfite exporter TauE/SafE family protein [Patescibacteria group bacterium]|nr:sulfite exporter TauE/SafE family protein [Patescibacteria group bacterium]MCL5095705.1 sulfite exporter TauE/SafE family protein [Patescibacteria group bacterium]